METSSGKDISEHPLLLPLLARNSHLSIGEKKRDEVCDGEWNKVVLGAQECRKMLKQRRNIWAEIWPLLKSAAKCLIGSYRTRISALVKEGFQEWDEKHICVEEVAGLSEALGQYFSWGSFILHIIVEIDWTWPKAFTLFEVLCLGVEVYRKNGYRH